MGSEGENANAALVRRLYELFNSGAAGTELMHPDVEYVNPPNAIEPGTRTGHEGLRIALESIRESFGDAEIEIERMAEEGDRVAVVVVMGIEGQASGIQGDWRHSHLWTFRDGKAERFEWWGDPRSAFDALERRAGA